MLHTENTHRGIQSLLTTFGPISFRESPSNHHLRPLVAEFLCKNYINRQAATDYLLRVANTQLACFGPIEKALQQAIGRQEAILVASALTE